jgi:hypothetical protein
MRSLNDIMEFDHVIRVHPDGSITEPRDDGVPYPPELNAINDDDGSHTSETDSDLQRQAADAGWTLETGRTGQYSYSGPCMHASEYVGGGLEDHIRATPGYWVTLVIMEDDDSEPESWAIAFHPSEDSE